MENAEVGQFLLFHLQQRARDPLGVDVGGDVIEFGVLGSGEQGRVAEAGADLEHTWGPPAEHDVEIQRVRGCGEVVVAAEFDERVTLPGGQASPACVVTADGFDHAVTLPIE